MWLCVEPIGTTDNLFARWSGGIQPWRPVQILPSTPRYEAASRGLEIATHQRHRSPKLSSPPWGNRFFDKAQTITQSSSSPLTWFTTAT